MSKKAKHDLALELIETGKTAIEEKRIVLFLKDTTQGDSDFSLYGTDGPYSGFVDYYHEQMYQVYCGYAGDVR